MNDLPQPRAILFDLDSTLTNRAQSIERYAERFYIAFAERLEPIERRDLVEHITVADGGGYVSRSELAQGMIRKLNWKVRPHWQEIEAHWRETFAQCTIPGHSRLTEILGVLRNRGLRLGMITNGIARSQNPKIDTLGVRHLFDVILISEDTGTKKPDPRIFQRALDLLNIPPNAAWFVGDHPTNDILGARAVGITPIWLTGIHPWPEREAPPRLIIHSLDEVPALLDVREDAPAGNESEILSEP